MSALVLAALVLPIAVARADAPTFGTIALTARAEADGDDNPATNFLGYSGIYATFQRAITPSLRWRIGGGVSTIAGDETEGRAVQVGAGGSFRTTRRWFWGAAAEIGWTYSRYEVKSEWCEVRGPLARAGLEGGVRLGRRSALVASAGLRFRTITSYVCWGNEGSGGFNLGPSLSLSYELDL